MKTTYVFWVTYRKHMQGGKLGWDCVQGAQRVEAQSHLEARQLVEAEMPGCCIISSMKMRYAK